MTVSRTSYLFNGILMPGKTIFKLKLSLVPFIPLSWETSLEQYNCSCGGELSLMNGGTRWRCSWSRYEISTPFPLNLFYETLIYICIFHNFYITVARYLKYFPVEDYDLFILRIQCHDCWCPGDARSQDCYSSYTNTGRQWEELLPLGGQDINSRGSDLNCEEYSGFNNRMVKTKSYDQLSAKIGWPYHLRRT